jgi:hypothetical protein
MTGAASPDSAAPSLDQGRRQRFSRRATCRPVAADGGHGSVNRNNDPGRWHKLVSAARIYAGVHRFDHSHANNPGSESA